MNDPMELISLPLSQTVLYTIGQMVMHKLNAEDDNPLAAPDLDRSATAMVSNALGLLTARRFS